MINHVTFPGLGLSMTINRVAFTVFGVPVYWYGICIALGLVLGLAFAFSKARSYGIDSDRMIDVVMLATLCAIVGARAYYVVFAPFEYESLWDMINLRDGGLAIYGGVLAAFVSALFLCRWRKVPTLPMFDLAAMGFLIGQGLGRWGNFFNQEAFGTNTTLPWGMYSEGTQNYLASVQATLAAQGVTVDPSLPVHPTFLYESLWCLLGFVVLFLYQKRRKFHGEIFLLYIIWYGAERFIVEGLRTDSLETVGGIRVSQLLALVSVIGAAGVWLWQRKVHRGQPLMITYPVVDKRLDGPAVLTWNVNETPSVQELKERIDRLVEQEKAAESKKDSAETEAAPAAEEKTQPKAATVRKLRADRAWVLERRAARQTVNVHAEAARALRSLENERPSRRRIRH